MKFTTATMRWTLLLVLIKLIGTALAADPERLFVQGRINPDYEELPSVQAIVSSPNNPNYWDRGNPGDSTFPASGKLGRCQSDCDNHNQCEEGLRCMQRQGNEHVPGCSGTPLNGEDYCYDPNTMEPTMSPAPSANPTGTTPTTSPTDFPTQEPSSSPAPTTAPSQAPSRSGLILLEDSQKPFRKCEGPCGGNDDCAGPLQCQPRTAWEPVTGCDGAGQRGSNYCYDPSDGPMVPSLPSGSFRLREYWEQGYFWQESYQEWRWCMHEEGGPGKSPVIRECRGSSTKYEFVYMQGPGDMIKVRDRNLCLERTGNQNVTFQGCDQSNLDQRWRGNWISRRFDIRPLRKDGCLTQHHHPRSGEVVYIQNCWTAHLTNTGYWTPE